MRSASFIFLFFHVCWRCISAERPQFPAQDNIISAERSVSGKSSLLSMVDVGIKASGSFNNDSLINASTMAMRREHQKQNVAMETSSSFLAVEDAAMRRFRWPLTDGQIKDRYKYMFWTAGSGQNEFTLEFKKPIMDTIKNTMTKEVPPHVLAYFRLQDSLSDLDMQTAMKEIGQCAERHMDDEITFTGGECKFGPWLKNETAPMSEVEAKTRSEAFDAFATLKRATEAEMETATDKRPSDWFSRIARVVQLQAELASMKNVPPSENTFQGLTAEAGGPGDIEVYSSAIERCEVEVGCEQVEQAKSEHTMLVYLPMNEDDAKLWVYYETNYARDGFTIQYPGEVEVPGGTPPQDGFALPAFHVPLKEETKPIWQKVVCLAAGDSGDTKKFLRKHFLPAFYVWTVDGRCQSFASPDLQNLQSGSLLTHDQFKEMLKDTTMSKEKMADEFATERPFSCLQMHVDSRSIRRFLLEDVPGGTRRPPKNRDNTHNHNPFQNPKLVIQRLTAANEMATHEKLNTVKDFWDDRHKNEPHSQISKEEAEAAMKTNRTQGSEHPNKHELKTQTYRAAIRDFREETEKKIKERLSEIHDDMDWLNVDTHSEPNGNGPLELQNKARRAYDEYFAKLASVNPDHMSDVVKSARIANKYNHLANEAMGLYLDRLIRTANLSHRVYNRAGLDHLSAHIQTRGQLEEGHMAPGRSIRIYFPISNQITFELQGSALNKEGMANLEKLASQIKEKLLKYRGMHFTICVHVSTQIAQEEYPNHGNFLSNQQYAEVCEELKTKLNGQKWWNQAQIALTTDESLNLQTNYAKYLSPDVAKLEEQTTIPAAFWTQFRQEVLSRTAPVVFQGTAEPTAKEIMDVKNQRQDNVIGALEANLKKTGMLGQITFPQYGDGPWRHYKNDDYPEEVGAVLVIAEDRLHKDEHLFDVENIKQRMLQVVTRLKTPRPEDIKDVLGSKKARCNSETNVAYRVADNKKVETDAPNELEEGDWFIIVGEKDAFPRKIVSGGVASRDIEGTEGKLCKLNIEALMADLCDKPGPESDERSEGFLDLVTGSNLDTNKLDKVLSSAAQKWSSEDKDKFQKGGTDANNHKCNLDDFQYFARTGDAIEDGQTLVTNFYGVGIPGRVHDVRKTKGYKDNVQSELISKLGGVSRMDEQNRRIVVAGINTGAGLAAEHSMEGLRQLMLWTDAEDYVKQTFTKGTIVVPNLESSAYKSEGIPFKQAICLDTPIMEPLVFAKILGVEKSETRAIGVGSENKKRAVLKVEPGKSFHVHQKVEIFANDATKGRNIVAKLDGNKLELLNDDFDEVKAQLGEAVKTGEGYVRAGGNLEVKVEYKVKVELQDGKKQTQIKTTTVPAEGLLKANEDNKDPWLDWTFIVVTDRLSWAWNDEYINMGMLGKRSYETLASWSKYQSPHDTIEDIVGRKLERPVKMHTERQPDIYEEYETVQDAVNALEEAGG